MSRIYQNVIGALTWVGTSDSDLASYISGEWESAREPIAKIVAVVRSGLNSEQVADAKRKLVDACANEFLHAFGHTKGNAENRHIPSLAWQGVTLDELNGSLGEGSGSWLGVRFHTRDLRRVFPDRPGGQKPAKAKTGPKSKYRATIAKIEEMRNIAIERALDRGDEIPPQLTGAEIARSLNMSARTANYHLQAIRRQS